MRKPKMALRWRVGRTSANPSVANPKPKARNTRLEDPSDEVKADTITSNPAGIKSQAIGWWLGSAVKRRICPSKDMARSRRASGDSAEV